MFESNRLFKYVENKLKYTITITIYIYWPLIRQTRKITYKS